MSEDRPTRILKFLTQFAAVTAAGYELYRCMTVGIIDDEYLLQPRGGTTRG